MKKLSSLQVLALVAVLLSPRLVLAANPTFYPNRAAFLAALNPGQTDTDDYSNPAYMLTQTDPNPKPGANTSTEIGGCGCRVRGEEPPSSTLWLSLAGLGARRRTRRVARGVL